jgi:hypothetical protein
MVSVHDLGSVRATNPRVCGEHGMGRGALAVLSSLICVPYRLTATLSCGLRYAGIVKLDGALEQLDVL